MLRFVRSHPRWTYARVASVFGVSRQAIGSLIITEEKRTGIKLHIREKSVKTPHLEHCRVCQRAIKKLQQDPAQLKADLYPGYSRLRRGDHLRAMKKAGALNNAILFFSKRRLKAYRAWRDGMPAVEIKRRYGFPNWHSTLAQLEKARPWVGRHERRDLRPNWQKDLEGRNMKRLIKFTICGKAKTEKGTNIPYKQSVHACSKRLAIQNAKVTLYKARGIKPITLRVKLWEKGNGNGRI